MNRLLAQNGCKSQELFCLRFKRRLRELLELDYSAAEAFGPAWEETLDEVALPDSFQGQVYWQLIDWAGRLELFTEANRLEEVYTE